MNDTYGAKEKYRRVITSLKIMYLRVDYNGDTINSDRYKKAYNILEIIQERRHSYTVQFKINQKRKNR